MSTALKDSNSMESELLGEGIKFHTGPFQIHLRSEYSGIAKQLRLLYPFAPLLDKDDDSLSDFTISLHRPYNLRRWWRPQVQMRTDAQSPFLPFPLDHAFPLLEWSYNWCIASQAHQFLMLHSAVVEKNGVALIMPAQPGSGKSTLCAALMLKGWRLLSDEFGLIKPTDKKIRFHSLPRPIPLKNESIDVIRHFSDKAILGPTFEKTRKGDVAHVMASKESQLRGQDTALAGWFLFPKYQANSTTSFKPLARGWTFMKVSSNSFNYKLQGARGFRTVTNLVNRCPAYALDYSDLNSVIPEIEKLHQEICTKVREREEPHAV